MSPLSKWSEGDWCEALTGLRTSSPGGRGGSGPVHPRSMQGLISFGKDEVARDGSDSGKDLAAAIGSYASSLPRLRISRFAPVQGRKQRTSNRSPKRQADSARVRFADSRGPSGPIIQSEWGLDLSSPPPLCSLSLGRCPGVKGWRGDPLPVLPPRAVGPRGRGEGRRGDGAGPLAGGQKVPRQSCLHSYRRARAHCPGRRGCGPAWASLHPPGG